MCSCVKQVFWILLYLGVLAFAAGSFGVLSSLAAEQMARLHAVLLMAFVVFTIIWYVSIIPRWARAERGASANLMVYVLNRLLAPVAVCGVGWVAWLMYEANYPANRVMMFFTAMLVVAIGVSVLTPKFVKLSEAIEHIDKKAEMNTKTLVVMTEGNICAGKSTLCRAAERAQPANAVQKPEQLHESLHAVFVDDGKQFAFAFQIAMCERRRALLAYEPKLTKKPYLFVDRSMLGDFAFLLWNFIAGSVTVDQLAVYRKEYGDNPREILKKLCSITDYANYVVCMVCTPATECRKRLDKRFGVDQGTGIDYLAGVSVAHYMCLASLLVVQKNSFAPAFRVHLLNGLADNSSQHNINTLLQRLKEHRSSYKGAEHIYRDLPYNIEIDADRTARFLQICNMLGIQDIAPLKCCEKTWHELVVELIKTS